MNKKLLESLVKSGACDDFGPNRAELLTQIDGALAQASAKARDRDAGQASLLDLLGPMEPAAKKSNGAGRGQRRARLVRCANGSATKRNCSAFTSPAIRSTTTRADLAAFQIHTVAQLKEIADEIDTRVCGLDHQGRSPHHARRTRSRGRASTFEDLTGAHRSARFPGHLRRAAAPAQRRRRHRHLRLARPPRRPAQAPRRAGALAARGVRAASARTGRSICRWRIGSIRRAGRQLRELVMDAPGPVKLRLVCSRGQWRRRALPRRARARRTTTAWRGRPNSRRGWKRSSAARATNCAPRRRSPGKRRSRGSSADKSALVPQVVLPN